MPSSSLGWMRLPWRISVRIALAERPAGVVGHGERHSALVIYRGPGGALVDAASSGGERGVERHEPLGDGHVRLSRLRLDRSADEQAVLGLAGLHGVGGLLAHGVVWTERSGLLERGHAGGVQSALDGLHVVALDEEAGEVALVRLDARPLEFGQVGDIVLRADVAPEQAAELGDAEGGRLHLRPERAVLRLQGHVQDVALDVELPVAAPASDAAFFDEAEREVSAAVRAAGVQQAESALGVAEGDEELSEELDPYGRRVRLREFVREEHGRPEAAEEFAHGSLRPHVRQQFVVFPGKRHRQKILAASPVVVTGAGPHASFFSGFTSVSEGLLSSQGMTVFPRHTKIVATLGPALAPGRTSATGHRGRGGCLPVELLARHP